jgi:hypothetical protein
MKHRALQHRHQFVQAMEKHCPLPDQRPSLHLLEQEVNIVDNSGNYHSKIPGKLYNHSEGAIMLRYPLPHNRSFRVEINRKIRPHPGSL